MNDLTTPSMVMQIDHNMLNHSNNSTTGLIDKYHYYGHSIVIPLSTILGLALIVAIVGNCLVILTILNNKVMRTRTNLLLCNLAVADILVAVIDIPVAIVTLISGKWLFSNAFCDFNGYMVGLGFMLSIHTLMWISIHKFLSITKPFHRPMTPGKIFCMILAAWIWSLLYNVGPLLGWTVTVYKKGASQCGPDVPKSLLQISHSLTNTIFNFIIPMCVMSYCYYKIFAEVREHMNRMEEFSDDRYRANIIQQRRISMTLLIVFMCFVLCWLPYIVYSCSLVALGKDKVWPILNPIGYMCGYINSACNPIIYALRSDAFRKGFKAILSGCNRIPEPDDPGYKWTRINGVVMSFRKSIRRVSRRNSDIVVRANDELTSSKPDKIGPTDDNKRKEFRQRKSNVFGYLTTKKSQLLTADDKSNQYDRSKRTSDYNSASSTRSISPNTKTEDILQNDDDFLDIDDIKSQNPNLNDEKYCMGKGVNDLVQASRKLSFSAPNLVSREIKLKPRVRDDSPQPQGCKVPRVRRTSDGNMTAFPSDKIQNDEKVTMRQSTRLMMTASTEKINFVSCVKRERSKSLWNSDDDGILGSKSNKLNLSNILTIVKKSFNDLFTLSPEDLEGGRRNSRRQNIISDSDESDDCTAESGQIVTQF